MALTGEETSAKREVFGDDSSTPLASTASTTTEVQAVPESDGATSTPPIVVVQPRYEEPFVLQPAVKLSINGSSLTADIKLENLMCKVCAKVLPALQVKAYYTTWYPNDGPEMKETSARGNERTMNVSDVALWGSRSVQWSADGVAPGRYYFVVVVDPDNAKGAYRMHWSEFRM